MIDDTPETISDEEKVRIATEFLLQSPPGEFNEVFNDVRVLLNNDALLKEGASSVFSEYNKEQFTPVKLPTSKSVSSELGATGESFCLLTPFNHSESNAAKEDFEDPRSKQTFIYDHLRKEVTMLKPLTNQTSDDHLEKLRSAFELQFANNYVRQYYHHGHVSVFLIRKHEDNPKVKMAIDSYFGKVSSQDANVENSKTVANAKKEDSKHNNKCSNSSSHHKQNDCILVCIEDHQFQPKNFWNGKWRSLWKFDVITTENSNSSSFLKSKHQNNHTTTPTYTQIDVTGLLRIQVHYYEDGNVQLVSSKSVDTFSLPLDKMKQELSNTTTIPQNTTEDSTGNESNSAPTHTPYHTSIAALACHSISSIESDYQKALTSNLQLMCDSTFKTLRRQLPLTRTKIDWSKIVSYSVGQELSKVGGDGASSNCPSNVENMQSVLDAVTSN